MDRRRSPPRHHYDDRYGRDRRPTDHRSPHDSHRNEHGHRGPSSYDRDSGSRSTPSSRVREESSTPYARSSAPDRRPYSDRRYDDDRRDSYPSSSAKRPRLDDRARGDREEGEADDYPSTTSRRQRSPVNDRSSDRFHRSSHAEHAGYKSATEPRRDRFGESKDYARPERSPYPASASTADKGVITPSSSAKSAAQPSRSAGKTDISGSSSARQTPVSRREDAASTSTQAFQWPDDEKNRFALETAYYKATQAAVAAAMKYDLAAAYASRCIASFDHVRTNHTLQQSHEMVISALPTAEDPASTPVTVS